MESSLLEILISGVGPGDASHPERPCLSACRPKSPVSWTAAPWVGVADRHPYQQCGQKFLWDRII